MNEFCLKYHTESLPAHHRLRIGDLCPDRKDENNENKKLERDRDEVWFIQICVFTESLNAKPPEM